MATQFSHRASHLSGICPQIHKVLLDFQPAARCIGETSGVRTHLDNEADTHKRHTIDTDIHKQAQDKTLFTITDLSSGAALAMPDANPAGPHKKAADAVLKASIGLAKANAEFLEDA
jgi:hypothetical protein